MVSPSRYSHSLLISLLQYKNYDRKIPFNKYMGNLILEQNLFGLMMDIICKKGISHFVQHGQSNMPF